MSINILPPARQVIITGAVVSSQQLVRAFNLKNVKVLNAKSDNPYDGKVNQVTEKDKALYKSTLGTPVFTDLTLQGGIYTTNSGRLITFQDIRLSLVLMNVSQSKKIVETEIQGSDEGDMLEYIGMSNYQVSINGIFNGPNGHYPIDEVNALQQLMKAPVAIAVVSTHLHNLDIYNLVIKEFVYDQEPGGYSKQNFSIQAISDSPGIIKTD
jgi:hypothetical protein